MMLSMLKSLLAILLAHYTVACVADTGNYYESSLGSRPMFVVVLLTIQDGLK